VKTRGWLGTGCCVAIVHMTGPGRKKGSPRTGPIPKTVILNFSGLSQDYYIGRWTPLSGLQRAGVLCIAFKYTLLHENMKNISHSTLVFPCIHTRIWQSKFCLRCAVSAKVMPCRLILKHPHRAMPNVFLWKIQVATTSCCTNQSQM